MIPGRSCVGWHSPRSGSGSAAPPNSSRCRVARRMPSSRRMSASPGLGLHARRGWLVARQTVRGWARALASIASTNSWSINIAACLGRRELGRVQTSTPGEQHGARAREMRHTCMRGSRLPAAALALRDGRALRTPPAETFGSAPAGGAAMPTTLTAAVLGGAGLRNRHGRTSSGEPARWRQAGVRGGRVGAAGIAAALAGARHATLFDRDGVRSHAASPGMADPGFRRARRPRRARWLAEPASPSRESFDVVLAYDVFFQDGCMPPLTRLLSTAALVQAGTRLPRCPSSRSIMSSHTGRGGRVLPPSSKWRLRGRGMEEATAMRLPGEGPEGLARPSRLAHCLVSTRTPPGALRDEAIINFVAIIKT